jgi:hypothetical protein
MGLFKHLRAVTVQMTVWPLTNSRHFGEIEQKTKKKQRHPLLPLDVGVCHMICYVRECPDIDADDRADDHSAGRVKTRSNPEEKAKRRGRLDP